MKIDSKDELKEIDIKDRTCYYFDDIIEIKDFDFDDISLNENLENIMVYSTSYKTLIGARPLCISFDKVDKFTRVYDGTRHLLHLQQNQISYKSEKWYYMCHFS